MTNRFNEQVAVVTGGSSGIGRAIAAALLAEGAKRVYITGRTQATLQDAATALGERVTPLQCDVSSVTQIDRLASTIANREDTLDMLFANAGIAENNTLGQSTERQYDDTMDINVKGLFFSVQSLLPLLADGSRIVLTSSMVSGLGMPNLSLYSASKAAVRSFARSWTRDLRERRIRVNALSPGFTRTPILGNGLKMSEQQIDEFAEQTRDLVPAGRMATPEEIAASALFLASPDSSYVNGVELYVDGGHAQV